VLRDAVIIDMADSPGDAEIRAAADRVGKAIADLMVAVLRAQAGPTAHAPVERSPVEERPPGVLTVGQEAELRTGMNVWLTSAQVARIAHRHTTTVTVALQRGDLHGHQRMRRGRWQVKSASVDAWLQGGDSYAACGCGDLPTVRKRKSVDVSVLGATARSAKHHRNKGLRS
jgi:hypothetical protein